MNYRRFFILLLVALVAVPLWSQKPKQGRGASKPKTTQTTKKPAKKQQQKSTTKQKAKPVDKKSQLQNERAATQQKRIASQQQADKLNRSIRNTLDSVVVLNHDIAARQQGIDTLNTHLVQLNVRLNVLSNSLDSLRTELNHRQSNYNRALRYMQRHPTNRQKMIYIFSAPTLEQTVRRAHYVRSYSSYQQTQGALIKQKQQEVREMQEQVSQTKSTMESQRSQLQHQQQLLEQQKTSQQEKVKYLNQNLATVQKQVQEYRKREAALNAEIDRIIQEEIAAEARRKAEAERKRKEAEAKRKAEEAKRKAEAEKKRLAEANKKTNPGAAPAPAAKPAPSTPAKPAATPAAKEPEWKDADDADTKLSNSFTANKGKLPMPVTGSYTIVGHYGQYKVNGLSNVTLDNKGIDIRCQQGASARAVFNGSVSSVFQYGGTNIVMIRHGNYISVYSGLQSVSVRKGATVSTRQALGTVARDDNGNYILHFQLRNLSSRLNPEQWLGR